MPRFCVTKSIEFCYGHRLLHYEGKCRHLHGHNATVELEVEGQVLDHRGMVVDFSDLKRIVKTWIDDELDHRMLLNRADPLVSVLLERGEPLVLMDENPTAETLARMIFQQCQRLGMPVTQVRLWETPSSYATYREDSPAASRATPQEET